jgi:hypothetical protein
MTHVVVQVLQGDGGRLHDGGQVDLPGVGLVEVLKDLGAI